MEYVKLDPLINTRPKMMKAGWWARQVYIFLVLTAGKYDLRGRFGPRYQDPEWLAIEWGILHGSGEHIISPQIGPLEAVALGLNTLLNPACGLLVRDGEDWVIDGWEEFYGKRDHSTDRVRKFRAKSAGTAIAPPDTPETDGTPPTHTTHAQLPSADPSEYKAGMTPNGLMHLWNATLGDMLPKVLKMSGSREKAAGARLKEFTQEQLQEAMTKIRGNPGLLGKVKSSGPHANWSASFDWFVQPLSIAKILEGKYDRWGTEQGGAKVIALRNPEDMYE